MPEPANVTGFLKCLVHVPLMPTPIDIAHIISVPSNVIATSVLEYYSGICILHCSGNVIRDTRHCNFQSIV